MYEGLYGGRLGKDARSTGASSGCQAEAEGGFGVPATAASPGTALMYPPARQQYARRSAVIQSSALACQMVSTYDGADTLHDTAESLVPRDDV